MTTEAKDNLLKCASSLVTSETPARPPTRVQAVPLPLDRPLPSHIPALDGIRGLAVLLVLFCHATQHPFGQGGDVNAFFPGVIDKIFLAAARFSWTGVDMFFVLSGFLITGILYDAKGKDHFFRNFYARRTVRIFPLYYACLILFLVVWPRLPGWLSTGFGQTPTSEIWYWLYLSNYAQGIAEQNGVASTHILHISWSLAIEEQFYLCWPLVVFLCGRKQLLRICAIMFFGSMVLRTALLIYEKRYWAISFTPCRIDGLAVGAVIALIARSPGGLRQLVKPAWIIGPFALLALGTTVVGMHLLGERHGIGQSSGYLVVGTALVSLIYGSILVAAIAAANGSFLNRVFAGSILRMFGKYSYAIYLLHLPVMILIGEWVFHPTQLKYGGSVIPGLLVYFTITWTLTVAAALISWHLLEKRFLKLKDWFPMDRPARTSNK